jgi:hypothetical protein
LKLPDHIETYFWDINSEDLDPEKHWVFVISRILNEGDHHALTWLFNLYSAEKIISAVKASRTLSTKTAKCWQNYFALKEEDLCCTGLR